MKKLSGPMTAVLLVPLVIAFCYIYPRAIISAFGIDSPWTNYLYMYGFGLVTFIIGIFLILKSGACNLKRKKDLFWFKALIIGMLFFITLHGTWIYLAISIPFKGEVL